MGKLWGIAALAALSLTACGGYNGTMSDNGATNRGTLTDDGTMSGGAYDNGVTNNGGAYDNGVTNNGGAYDNGVTNNGGVYDNGVTNGGVYDNGVTNGAVYDNRYSAAERNAQSNGTVTNGDGVTDYGDTARRYDSGDTERSKQTVTDRDANTERSMLERASDALEDGVQRARDGVENARERINS